jgi:hypothetical protein
VFASHQAHQFFAVAAETTRPEMEMAVMSHGRKRAAATAAGGRGLGRVVREHRARLRIICRCVALLVRYRD